MPRMRMWPKPKLEMMLNLMVPVKINPDLFPKALIKTNQGFMMMPRAQMQPRLQLEMFFNLMTKPHLHFNLIVRSMMKVMANCKIQTEFKMGSTFITKIVIEVKAIIFVEMNLKPKLKVYLLTIKIKANFIPYQVINFDFALVSTVGRH